MRLTVVKVNALQTEKGTTFTAVEVVAGAIAMVIGAGLVNAVSEAFEGKRGKLRPGRPGRPGRRIQKRREIEQRLNHFPEHI